MPGKVKVKVLAGRHLPVMDRSNDTTDAFVEVKLGGTTCKTDVCRKSLNPQWNSEWFKFEMDDLELQDEPLQIRLMDYDTYSANDAIGKVYIDLNPLLTNPSKTKEPSGRAMSGWIPVYDTMHGIRGEVNLMVKVELFSDLNKFRQSSCGVKFFFTQAIPDGHVAIQLHGFVEELVVNDDPEYQWIDKIRTPRASNEARQLLFLKLAGEVQRRVGLKALELGGNAVIGYRVCFDLEGELGIVVRGIGTAATLAKTIVDPVTENLKEFHTVEQQPPFPETFPDVHLNIPCLPSHNTLLVHHAVSINACDHLNLTHPSVSFADLPELPSPNVLSVFPDVTNEMTSNLSSEITSRHEGLTAKSDDPPRTMSPTRAKLAELSDLSSQDKAGSELSPKSPTSDTFPDTALSQFEIQRRRRGSKKRDKYSTSSLLKRVSKVSSADGKDNLTAGEKIRTEFVNFFRRRRRFLSGDTESSPDKEISKVKSSSFRKTKFEKHLLFFRRGRRGSRSRRSSSLRRSSSESFSIERISLESFPSAKSELGIDFDWSQVQIPMIENAAASLNPLLDYELPKMSNTFDPETLIPSDEPNPPSTHLSSGDPFSSMGGIPSSSSIIKAINDLGYTRGEKPLTLYISSLDALLVCAPSKGSSCRALNECKTVDNLAEIGLGDLSELRKATDKACPPSDNLQSEVAHTHSEINSKYNLSQLTTASTNPVSSETDTNNYRRTRDAVISSGSVASDGNVPPADSIAPKTILENASAHSGDSTAAPSTSESEKQPVTDEISSSEIVTTSEATAPPGPEFNKFVEVKEESSLATVSGGRKKDSNAKTGSVIHVSNKTTSSSSSSSIHTRNGSTGNSATHHKIQVAHFNKAAGSVNMLPPPTSGVGANCRRSSDSELSTPPAGAMNSSIEAIISHNKNISFAKRLASGTDHFDLLEYPFVTIGQLPPRFVQNIGGAVSARSVKLLERTSNLEEPETRDSWWTEIRLEIRSHARSLCCNVILGYEEQTTICDDVCILSATGTAALVNSSALHELVDKVVEVSSKLDKDKVQVQNEASCNGMKAGSIVNSKIRHGSAEDPECSCSICHIPYSEAYLPFPVKMVRCQICKKDKVPDMLLATIGFPSSLPICGKTSLIQAHVFRAKKDSRGESSAKEVSDSVPFLEYELHRRLINKLKMKGMNAIFCLQVQICLGETLMIGVATGTAVCLAGLPPPTVPKITGGNLKTDTQKVAQFQRVVQDTYDRNREYYRITSGTYGHYQIIASNGHQSSDEEDDDEDVQNVDLATGNKDAYVLEVDDAEDIDIISELVDPSPPTAFEMNNLDTLVGYDDYRVVSQQVFAQIWRCHVPNMTLRHLAGYFDRLLRAIGFKLRAMRPCVINKLRFRVELPEPDEIQISIVGTALGLTSKTKVSTQEMILAPKPSPVNKKSLDDGDMIFELDYDGSSTDLKRDTDLYPSGQTLISIRTSVGETSELAPPQDMGSINLSKSPDTSGGVQLNMQATTQTIPIPGTETAGHSMVGTGRTPTLPSFLTPKTSTSPHISNSCLPQISRSLLVPNLARTITKPLLSRKGKYVIEVTTLSSIPGYRIEKYLGNLNCFFIRESTSIKEMGGPSGFVHNFVVEVLAILRAHVAALGGNALVSYFMTELSILHNPHKNQGQCLINVGGDVVNILPSTGFDDEKRVEEA